MRTYAVTNTTIFLLRFAFVFLLPTVDFLTDVALVTNLFGPALETTTVCVTGTRNYKGGTYTINGEFCGPVDQYAAPMNVDAGCPLSERKAPKEGMCYSSDEHAIGFLQHTTNGIDIDCRAQDQCDSPQQVGWIPNGYDFTVCNARSDFSTISESCGGHRCVEKDNSPVTTPCSSCEECVDRWSCHERNNMATRPFCQSGRLEFGSCADMETSGTSCCEGTCRTKLTQVTNGFGQQSLSVVTFCPEFRYCQWYGTDKDGYCGNQNAHTLCNDAETEFQCERTLENGVTPCVWEGWEVNTDPYEETAEGIYYEVFVVDGPKFYPCNVDPSFTTSSSSESNKRDEDDDEKTLLDCSHTSSLLKCKATYRDEIPVHATGYDGKYSSFVGKATRLTSQSAFQAPTFDKDGYPTNYESMCAQCATCNDRVPYECGTRMFLCCVCQSPIADGKTTCCGNDDWKHLASKQCGGPGVCGRGIPAADLNEPVTLASHVSMPEQLSEHILDPVLIGVMRPSQRSAVLDAVSLATVFRNFCEELGVAPNASLVPEPKNKSFVCELHEYDESVCPASMSCVRLEGSDKCGEQGLRDFFDAVENEYKGLMPDSALHDDLLPSYVTNGRASASRHDYADGKCSFREVGIFDESYYDTNFWCEPSDLGPYPYVYSRFNTVVTGTAKSTSTLVPVSSTCQGVTVSFGVDMNTDEMFVGPVGTSKDGLPFTCSPGNRNICSECSLLPFSLINASKANVLAASYNFVLAILLIILVSVVIVKEVFGCLVVAFVVVLEGGDVSRLTQYDFTSIGRDSVVGLVVTIVLTLCTRGVYLGRAMESDEHMLGKLRDPYPTLQALVWIPLEYMELFVEIIFSVVWIVSLHDDGTFEIPEGSNTVTILVSWVFGMCDLWLFRAPQLVEAIREYVCRRGSKERVVPEQAKTRRRGSSRSRSRSASRQDGERDKDEAMSTPGTPVRICGLENNKDMNGVGGRVAKPHPSKKRYVIVAIERNGIQRQVSISRDNLALDESLDVGTRVEMRGLKNHKEMNGTIAIVRGFVPESGRVLVRVVGTNETVALERRNLFKTNEQPSPEDELPDAEDIYAGRTSERAKCVCVAVEISVYLVLTTCSCLFFVLAYLDRRSTCNALDDGINGILSEMDSKRCTWCEDDDAFCGYTV